MPWIPGVGGRRIGHSVDIMNLDFPICVFVKDFTRLQHLEVGLSTIRVGISAMQKKIVYEMFISLPNLPDYHICLTVPS